MSQIADSVTGDQVTSREAGALESRLLRTMTWTVIVAVAIAAILAPWRFTTGLLLGGGLSILNYRWLHSSTAAIVSLSMGSQARRGRSTRYLFRYLVVAAAVFAAYQFQIVSLAAAILGLCSFVPALFVEAFRQFYFIIIHREESF